MPAKKRPKKPNSDALTPERLIREIEEWKHLAEGVRKDLDELELKYLIAKNTPAVNQASADASYAKVKRELSERLDAFEGLVRSYENRLHAMLVRPSKKERLERERASIDAATYDALRRVSGQDAK